MAGLRRYSDGERRLVATRLPTEIADQVADAAAQRGMTITDYLATMVYAELGIPQPPASQPIDQAQLPLSA